MAKRDSRKGDRWSYTAGHYPYSVRVYERERGGVLQVAVHDPRKRNGKGGEKRKSLKHREREAAIQYADEQASKLRKGQDELLAPEATVRHVLALYAENRTPDKSRRVRKQDRRQIALWKGHLGADFDLTLLSRRQWDGFVRKRRNGELGPQGETVMDPDNRQPVGDRTIEIDLKFLRAVCAWACDWRDDSGRLLLESDPTRGYDLPKEKNPARPVASHDRVDAIRKHYRKLRVRIEWDGKQENVETPFPEIFEIAVGTGRRISAILQLRHEDLDLERTEAAPWGAIVWPEDTDKMGKRWRCPIGPDVRGAIDSSLRKRRHAGPGPLFPAPKDRRASLRYEIALKWLREAEKLAELDPQDGGAWHPYRRLWASARKSLSDVDVAQAGGWSSLAALKLAYQRPDDATMLKVVTDSTELREVK